MLPLALMMLAAASTAAPPGLDPPRMAVVRYSACEVAAAQNLDHGGDAAAVAQAVAAQCVSQYWGMVAAITRISRVRAFMTNYDRSYQTVVSLRSIPRAQ